MSISNKRELYTRFGFFLYAATSILVLIYISLILHWNGKEGLKTVLLEGPNSKIKLTMLTVVLAWLLIGSILVCIKKVNINKDNILSFITFYLFSFIYLNFLRERTLYGDVGDYINAAINLYSGQPFHSRYLYPPLWATLLQPFVPMGREFIFLLCYLANYLSLLLFFILLYHVLKKYGFSKNLSALTIFAILCVNVPILRTLSYVQVNFHLSNLILLSLLFYRKNIIISALALSLAVHLKVSPIILLLPYIYIRDWKYLIYFTVITIGIIIFTSLMNDFGYYHNFLTNISNIYTANPLAFRDNSLDSLDHSFFLILHIKSHIDKFLTSAFKIFFIIVSLLLTYKCTKINPFYNGERNEEIVYNSYIILLFLMTIISPVIWVHHLVFIIFPFLIILKRVSQLEEIIIYLLSYILIFLIPTFDFYPISYNRLLGLILCYISLYLVLREKKQEDLWFNKYNKLTFNV